VPHGVFGDAAEHQAGDAAPAVRADDDDIGRPQGGLLDDDVCRSPGGRSGRPMGSPVAGAGAPGST